MSDKLPQQDESAQGAVGSNVGLGCGALKLLARIQRNPIELRYGRSRWVPNYLPVGTTRADFDELMKTNLVKIDMGRLLPNPLMGGLTNPPALTNTEFTP